MASVALIVAGNVFTGGKMKALGGYIYIDALSAFIISIVAIIGLLAALYSVGYINHEIKEGEVPKEHLSRYYFGFYIFIFTMLLVVTSNNLGIMWVAVEGTTLASALLVGFYNKKSSLEAAWKYIIICTVGIIFAFFGTIILYFAAVSASGEGSDLLNYQNLINLAKDMNPQLLKLSFIFVLIGYGTKVGFAPMHTWLPDAHSQAPSPVSAMLSGVLLNCALYGILRFHLIVSKSLGVAYTSQLLIIFGLLSIAVALPFIIVQHDIKRLLAYSSIEHMGIIALAIGFGGRIGLYGAFLHMLNHALTKSTLFFTVGNITQKYHTKKINKIKGVVQTLPISGSLFMFGALAIGGSPPFGIFLSEFNILSAGFTQGKSLAAGTMLVLISFIFAGIIYTASKMFFGSRPGRITPGELSKYSSWVAILPIIPLTILGLYIPKFLNSILGQVIKVMTGGN